ncbi:MAG: fructose-bisphosphate aldolase [Candidatus Woesearchaeota archaeon]
MRLSLKKLSTDEKSLILAYDQGLEHGPTDFDDVNVDPNYILEIAKKGKYNAVILQKGIAEKYYDGSVPLIVKLNGKTNFQKQEPIAPLLCSVKEAIDIGACAVGYTIYVGSAHEAMMFREFRKVQEQAHDRGLPVIAWMYPRGAAIKNELDKNTLAYSARIGLELGADILKMKYNGSVEDLKWIIKVAGQAKVMIAGGSKTTDKNFLQEASDVISAGCFGLAVGRNIWQNKEPLKITEALRKVVFDGASVNEALKSLD